jgi:hypothetical protein
MKRRSATDCRCDCDEVALTSERADLLLEPRFDEGVDVLNVDVRIGGLGFVAGENAGKTPVELLRVLLRQRPALTEGQRIGARSRDLLADQPPIERKRPVELPEESIRLGVVIAAPQFSHIGMLNGPMATTMRASENAGGRRLTPVASTASQHGPPSATGSDCGLRRFSTTCGNAR